MRLPRSPRCSSVRRLSPKPCSRVASRVSRSSRRSRSSSSAISARLGIDRADVDGARESLLGQRRLTARELGASRCELCLRSGERLLGLVECRETLLDVLEPLLRRLGCARRPTGEIGLDLQQEALTCLELALATVELVSVRREPDLSMLERPVVRAPDPAGAAPRAAYSVDELALSCLDRGDPLSQLESKPAELLLRRRCESRAGAPAPSGSRPDSLFCLPNNATRR